VPAIGAASASESLQAACLGAISEPVLALGANRRVLLANVAFERTFAVGKEQLLGRDLAETAELSPAMRELATAVAAGADEAKLTLAGAGRFRLHRRRSREGGLILTCRLDTNAPAEGASASQRQRFAEAITMELLRGTAVAVIFLDLDRFKLVNDTLGHPVGDALLAAVVDRIRSLLVRGEAFVRLGGDEFGIACAGESAQANATDLATQIISLIDRPALIQGHVVHVGASAGIAVAPRDGHDADTLIRRADLALYAAKEGGRGVWKLFDAAMDERMAERRKLEFELRRAVKLKEFRLHYQAQGSADGSGVVGAEALIRWQHPTRGLLAPFHFLDLAEEIGLMPVLGAWVIDTACREAGRWPTAMTVAVNVSPSQFLSGKIVGIVARALEVTGLDPQRLELEITETVLLNGTDSNLRTLQALRAMGCRIAMDDFGTGYSSLSYLSLFPFDKIKLDKSFVQRMEGDPTCDAIARTVAELGHKLGMKTIAEGVETQSQMDAIRDQGFDAVQGYLLSKPIPPERLSEIMPGIALHIEEGTNHA